MSDKKGWFSDQNSENMRNVGKVLLFVAGAAVVSYFLFDRRGSSPIQDMEISTEPFND